MYRKYRDSLFNIRYSYRGKKYRNALVHWCIIAGLLIHMAQKEVVLGSGLLVNHVLCHNTMPATNAMWHCWLGSHLRGFFSSNLELRFEIVCFILNSLSSVFNYYFFRVRFRARVRFKFWLRPCLTMLAGFLAHRKKCKHDWTTSEQLHPKILYGTYHFQKQNRAAALHSKSAPKMQSQCK